MAATDYPDFEKCLRREYASFFQPMEKTFYSSAVSFIDPMIQLTGVDAYKGNVDTLAGRTALGKLLFQDASIVLHNIVQLEKNKIQTRWTLQVTAKMFPGQPRAKFSGVSLYTLDENSKQVITQEDYWDSINLREGKYVTVPRSDGLFDFLGQLNQPKGAEMAAPELPYELLRRAKRYEVRRYPATVIAETSYEQRPQGYDRLGTNDINTLFYFICNLIHIYSFKYINVLYIGSYVSRSNVANKKLSNYAPTLMRVKNNAESTDSSSSSGNKLEKFMSWPLAFQQPGSALASLDEFPQATIPSIKIAQRDSIVVAVCRFDVAATEPVARGYTDQLRRDVLSDKMKPTEDVGKGVILVAQYDALFSINKRRNEVWIELEDHPWL